MPALITTSHNCVRTLVEETQQRDDLTASYVVPTYNRPTWSARAVASIINSARESDHPVEIIVTDNSTTDEVLKGVLPILRNSGCDYRVYRNSPPVGMVPNMNLGLSNARGEYVAFVHDDDFVTKNAIPDHHKEITNHPRPVYLFGVKVVNSAEKRIRLPKRVRVGDHTPANAVRMLLGDSSFVRFPGILALREAYSDVGGFNASLGAPADVDMWFRLFARYGVRVIPTTTAAYTLHGGALTHGMFNAETIQVVNGIFERAQGVTGLTVSDVEKARASFLTKFLVAGTWRALRSHQLSRARSVIRLRDSAQLSFPAQLWLELVYRVLRKTL
ncbi:MAG: glycosyltransferase [Thioalkalivibrio sp.]|nr:glycosyltransferase [Thioalkalivibrio sp.]